MSQSKIDSILESLTNILLGATVALLAQLVWFPFIGKTFTIGENLMTMAFFTAVSFFRAYSIRRFFNNKSVYQLIWGNKEDL